MFQGHDGKFFDFDIFGLYTLPETNSSPLQSYLLNRKVVFQPPFFRGYLSFREGIYRAEFEI